MSQGDPQVVSGRNTPIAAAIFGPISLPRWGKLRGRWGHRQASADIFGAVCQIGGGDLAGPPTGSFRKTRTPVRCVGCHVLVPPGHPQGAVNRGVGWGREVGSRSVTAKPVPVYSSHPQGVAREEGGGVGCCIGTHRTTRGTLTLTRFL